MIGMAKPVKCERCGRENNPSLRFCLDCGQPLPLPSSAEKPADPTCGRCGAAVRTGFRFCAECGFEGIAEGSQSNTTLRGLRLTTTRTDGAAGPAFPLLDMESGCGRLEGVLRLPDDVTVSPAMPASPCAGKGWWWRTWGARTAPSCASARLSGSSRGRSFGSGASCSASSPCPARKRRGTGTAAAPGGPAIRAAGCASRSSWRAGARGDPPPARGREPAGQGGRRGGLPGRPIRVGPPRPDRPRGRRGDRHQSGQLQRDFPAHPRSHEAHPGRPAAHRRAASEARGLKGGGGPPLQSEEGYPNDFSFCSCSSSR